ncbi:sporulation specific protein Spo13 [Schizosaccharomyces cryophilus OY26]|uniref:Sporulation specific protein Spo13 n=1 Tax=Schizosaccharomyces cryophilus (strain OY26 / ATCC MYA-4695 / CBS 11777 / NBRC 106824 / NRRL Y48691) TaxID=653667 RepID=S9VUR6_SCHCR|nr:sporulation specific protein Spo13 [Schizosaccharomyces cryophilus OY26]EPY49904.1 sporulation specific protein Spo13 [Schizosaccharomyces cryophilus OY26]
MMSGSQITRLFTSMSNKENVNEKLIPEKQKNPTNKANSMALSQMKEQLSHEVQRREELESQLDKSQKEMEELSVSLFTEANEMVAKARQETEVLRRELDYHEKMQERRMQKLKNIQSAIRTSMENRKFFSYSYEAPYQ